MSRSLILSLSFSLSIIARCGLMLTLSTNLVIWMTAVTEESLHQTTFPEYPENTTKMYRRDMYIGKGK